MKDYYRLCHEMHPFAQDKAEVREKSSRGAVIEDRFQKKVNWVLEEGFGHVFSGGGRCIRPSYIGKDLQELQPYHHQPQQQQQHHHPHHTLIYPDQQYTGQYPGVEGYSLRPHPSGKS